MFIKFGKQYQLGATPEYKYYFFKKSDLLQKKSL